MRLRCIADGDTVRGLRLAGVEGEEAASVEQAREALGRALHSADLAVVILTESLAMALEPEIRQARLNRDQPLLVVIPGPSGPLPRRITLRRQAEIALGVGLGREVPPP